jgi:L-ascorbate metabolism protein UlaG (beta-lactamase superfamily)
MSDLERGLQAWRQMSNHNRMIDLQEGGADDASPARPGDVEIAFFGSSAFRITTPLGLTLMVDPWRNYPTGTWNWYFRDFPRVAVDVGVCSHAHFDHDALHRLDAHVLLDRLIGRYEFADLRITGIAEKHETDSSRASYDFKKLIKAFQGIDITPPDNPRSWDHCLLLIETGGLRIVHWGDNRHDPPPETWHRLGTADVLLLPVDASQHVMGLDMAEHVIDTLRPKVVIPHHYYIWDLTVRSSTLREADPWVEGREHLRLDGPSRVYRRRDLEGLDRMVHFFGDHVAFDKERWRAGEYEDGGLYP